ncbi:Serine/arginine-rich splicing factor 3 isoform X1 [Aix galericulata]|nr:Serine/arginine-rich splicing factor 3 isoform X1 [Aix galericulata]
MEHCSSAALPLQVLPSVLRKGARRNTSFRTMHRDSCPLDCKVYVGNLGNNGNKTELERAFGYYGPLRSVWVARNPPGFAFVEFEDPRDAADAVRELDGRTLCGCRVRVELSNGEKRSRNRGPPPSWGRRPRDDYRRRSPPPRRRSRRTQTIGCFPKTIRWCSPVQGLRWRSRARTSG